jgi:hypothetical protein
VADDDQWEARNEGASLPDIDWKLDKVAGALATIAANHTELLAHVADTETRRSQDIQEVAQRLDALERQILALPGGAAAPADQLQPLRADVTLGLDVLARLAESVEHIRHRTDDRLAMMRDAALAPIADLQKLLSARDEVLADLSAAVNELLERGPSPVRERLAELSDAVRDLRAQRSAEEVGPMVGRVEELVGTVHSLSWQLPELADQLAAVRDQVERIDLHGPLDDIARDLRGRLTLHTDTALAGALRVIDDRLAALRNTLLDGGGGSASPANVGGFEAGAVLGAAQAAWSRLEQRLDEEFDDLSRQLQAMASLIEQAVASSEAVANRPVVTGDQLRKAASAVKETVVGAGRSRRERRGGPKGIGAAP